MFESLQFNESHWYFRGLHPKVLEWDHFWAKQRDAQQLSGRTDRHFSHFVKSPQTLFSITNVPCRTMLMCDAFCLCCILLHTAVPSYILSFFSPLMFLQFSALCIESTMIRRNSFKQLCIRIVWRATAKHWQCAGPCCLNATSPISLAKLHGNSLTFCWFYKGWACALQS